MKTDMSASRRVPSLCRTKALLERIARSQRFLLVLFFFIYTAGFGLIGAKKILWNDELFTLYISRLPHFDDIWAALKTGAEQTPPLSFAITRASVCMLGTSGLTIRLPEILAFGLMCSCLFCLVSRRTSPVFGFISMLFPFMTTAFNYVVEGRAYALVVAFTSFALLCWMWAGEGRRRTLALTGLAVSLAAAVSCHYYAVLGLFPLGMGELARTFRRKKFDAGVWLALILSMSPLLIFLPLIESARKFAPHFWAKPRWSSIGYYYEHFLLAPSAVPLLVMLLAVAIYCSFLRSKADERRQRTIPDVPPHEVAAVIGFLLIPAVGVILAKTVVGAYSDPYALPAVIGLSIIIAWGLYSALEGQEAPALALGLLLCAFLTIKQAQTYRRLVMERSLKDSTYAFLEANAQGDAPIVISGPTNFTELTYGAPPALGTRLIYLADPGLAVQYTGTDDPDRGLIEMKSWAGLNVLPFRSFVASAGPCYIYAQSSRDQYAWTVRAFQAARLKVTLVNWREEGVLLSAEPGHDKEPTVSGK